MIKKIEIKMLMHKEYPRSSIMSVSMSAPTSAPTSGQKAAGQKAGQKPKLAKPAGQKADQKADQKVAKEESKEMAVERVSRKHSIFFHGNCIDGWFSAYLTHKALTKQGLKGIRLYPVAPTGAGLPPAAILKDVHIHMVDVSFPAAQREAWVKAGAASVECIDHHPSSVEHWPSECCPIHTESCAALQVFRHYFPEETVPTWLEIIDRVDRWDQPTYNDRCVREQLNALAHKPMLDKRAIPDILQETEEWIAQVSTPEGQMACLTEGKALLDAKDAELNQVLQGGVFIQLTFEHVEKWQLPANWLGANVFIIDNTKTVFDTTEASHVVFTTYPGCDVFVNYRRKTYLTKGSMSVEKNCITYYARSQTFNLTEGTIFNGHPTAAGASLTQDEAPVLPFIF